MSKKVLITGVTGQDGSYMVDYLFDNSDCEIYGMVRRLSTPNHDNIKHVLKNNRFKLVTGDLSDSHSIDKIVEKIKPDYFINFAAQSFVAASWDLPEMTMDVNSSGVLRCLEAIRKHVPSCRFYNAGSSEEFGDVQFCPQTEAHPLRARSPYGASKISSRQIVKTYRESYNLYAIQGYLFNHESPRRGIEFVTRKITDGVAKIYLAIKNNKPFEPIQLGNLDAKRDWSHSLDFMDGVWRMLNQDIYRKDWEEKRDQAEYHGDSDLIDFDEKKDIKEYILSSDHTHSIRDFVEAAFKEANIEGFWQGKEDKEQYFLANYIAEDNPSLNSCLVKVNPQFYRPAEVSLLIGNSSPARAELGWSPKYSFQDLVSEMVRGDIEKNLDS